MIAHTLKLSFLNFGKYMSRLTNRRRMNFRRFSSITTHHRWTIAPLWGGTFNVCDASCRWAQLDNTSKLSNAAQGEALCWPIWPHRGRQQPKRRTVKHRIPVEAKSSWRSSPLSCDALHRRYRQVWLWVHERSRAPGRDEIFKKNRKGVSSNW